ncbi:hypothetical protein JG687_00014841, partial [Phytophthora cactorum]
YFVGNLYTGIQLTEKVWSGASAVYKYCGSSSIGIKKNRVRQTAVGNFFFVGVLLPNSHTLFQPLGNQILMLFNLHPPTLDPYIECWHKL